MINKKVDCPKGKALLISDGPFRDFNKLSQYFKPFLRAEKSIADSAIIGKNTIIQPNVFIGNNVIIGDNCVIHANVSLYDNTVIGNHVTIHAGSILGADAFYYKNRPEYRDRLLSSGNVVVEDDVDIGAACTIGMSESLRPRTTALLAICTNLIPFLYANRNNFYEMMRGIIFPTVVLSIVWLFYFDFI